MPIDPKAWRKLIGSVDIPKRYRDMTLKQLEELLGYDTSGSLWSDMALSEKLQVLRERAYANELIARSGYRSASDMAGQTKIAAAEEQIAFLKWVEDNEDEIRRAQGLPITAAEKAAAEREYEKALASMEKEPAVPRPPKPPPSIAKVRRATGNGAAAASAPIPPPPKPTQAWDHIVQDSRRMNVLDLTTEARQTLAQSYVDEIDRVYARLAAGKLRPDQVEAFLRDLRRALIRAGAHSETEVKKIMIDAATRARNAYVEAVQMLEQTTGQRVASPFAGVPVEAVENLFFKRELGLIRSFKTLGADEGGLIANKVGEALQRAIAGGKPAREAASEIARALVQQDDHFKAAVERFGHGPQLLKWARQAEDGPTKDMARAAGRIGYNARRIARTEINSAYHEASILSAKRSRVVKGVKWNLSPRHPAPDICDVAAGIDLYGLGEGVYPVDFVFSILHPHCLCFITTVLRPQSEWGEPLPMVLRPEDVTVERIAVYMEGVTARELEVATAQMNKANSALWELYEAEQRRAAA